MTGYALLILGLGLWAGFHLWKRLAPANRARFGEPGKGIVALGVLAAVVLMVVGYRAAPVDPIWPRSSGMVHANNLLVALAFYLFAASGMKSAATRMIRHPQLWAVRLWALAHLMVNGDAASLILFGGLFVWAQAEVYAINRAEPYWEKPAIRSGWPREIGVLVAALAVMATVAAIHTWLGYWPFG